MKILLIALVVSTAAVSTLGLDEPADWVLENCVDRDGRPTTIVTNGVRCDLKNRTSGTCLVRKSHDDQTDWDFAACASSRRSVTITARQSARLACGETVALKIGHEYFRKCRNPQKVGINICSESASAPAAMHYDWQFQGCQGSVAPGQPVALYNVSRKDAVVYAKRAGAVADTCWSDSMKFGQCTSARDK